MLGLLSFDTFGIGLVTLHCEGLSQHCRLFGSTPGLYPLDTRSISQPVATTRVSLDVARCPLGGKITLNENCWFR